MICPTRAYTRRRYREERPVIEHIEQLYLCPGSGTAVWRLIEAGMSRRSRASKAGMWSDTVLSWKCCGPVGLVSPGDLHQHALQSLELLVPSVMLTYESGGRLPQFLPPLPVEQ